jgi:hypothetical protein
MSDAKDLDVAQVLKQSFDADIGGLRVATFNNLIPVAYDSIQLSYTGDNLTEVVYKQNGNTVAILNLTYTGDRLTQVDRS